MGCVLGRRSASWSAPNDANAATWRWSLNTNTYAQHAGMGSHRQAPDRQTDGQTDRPTDRQTGSIVRSRIAIAVTAPQHGHRRRSANRNRQHRTEADKTSTQREKKSKEKKKGIVVIAVMAGSADASSHPHRRPIASDTSLTQQMITSRRRSRNMGAKMTGSGATRSRPCLVPPTEASKQASTHARRQRQHEASMKQAESRLRPAARQR
ncbi:hypothetical protein J3F83DRAFT_256267 [Trichoderma novae-zelandiae]